MILVTGAAGKTGQAVIRALARRGAAVRAYVRRAEQIATVQAAGAQEWRVGTLHDAGALRHALQGVHALYAICPNMHPDEVAIAQTLLDAALAAPTPIHVVYHSVLHPQTEEMPHHWHKLRVEERIFASGLPFTILQPTVYMQNLAGSWRTILDQGRYPIPYPVATHLSYIHLDDVGDAAATVLTNAGHEAAIYELVGTRPLSQTAIATLLSARLGRPVAAHELALDDWEHTARATGLEEFAVTTLRRMFAYYAAYGLVGNPNILTWLLGRAPRSFADYLAAQPIS